MDETKSLAKATEIFDGKIIGINETHYQALMEDLKDIFVESIYHSRIELVRAKWMIGQRIMSEFHETKITEYKNIIERLGKDLKTSVSELYRCTEFFNKYLLEFKCKTFEDILELLPDGKSVSWNKIKLLYLPEVPSARIPYIVPLMEMQDEFGLIKWWAQHPDRNFTLVLSSKVEDVKLQIKLFKANGKRPQLTPLKELFKELGSLYIQLKKWDVKDLDGSDYARMNKSIKRLLIKAKGDKEKVKRAINWVAAQDYQDWSFETVEKKYADAIRPVKPYEKFLKKEKKW